MGTRATVTIVTADSAGVAGIARDALATFHHVDSLMSNWTDQSEVARINHQANSRAISIDPEVANVIAFAQLVARQSDGAFDITIEPLVRSWGFLGEGPRLPSQDEIDQALASVGYEKVELDTASATLQLLGPGVAIDLGGIAKGYAADRAAEVLRRHEIADALVDLSGNMVAIGNAPTHEGWTVGIRDPSRRHPYVARLRLFDECVATSGDYEQFVAANGKRYGHILDPRSGWSARGLTSVTVVAAKAMSADAWATALFVLGPEDARRLAKARDDLSVVLIEPREDGPDVIWVEAALRPQLQIVEELQNDFTVRDF